MKDSKDSRAKEKEKESKPEDKEKSKAPAGGGAVDLLSKLAAINARVTGNAVVSGLLRRIGLGVRGSQARLDSLQFCCLSGMLLMASKKDRL